MRWIDKPLFWLVAYFIMSCLVLNRTVLWMFFTPVLPTGEFWDVQMMCVPFVLVFSCALWQGIVRNELPSAIEKILAGAMIISFICTVTMVYALAYRYMGLIEDGNVTHDPTTCLYFSIVTWTTLGFGDVRPVPDARLLAASEAVVGYIFMGAYIGMLSVLFRQIFGGGMNGPISRERAAERRKVPNASQVLLPSTDVTA